MEYLPQRNEKKESQKAKENELPIAAKGEEGKTERGQRERAKEGRRVRRTGKMQILYYNTKHTRTHTCISCIYTYITHTEFECILQLLAS